MNRNATSPWPFVGIAGMAAAFFLYAASGLIAPWWAVVLLLVVWLFLFIVACGQWTRRPRVVPVVALVTLLLWFAVIIAGGAWLGWTA